jgi:6-phosphogluconate dehydrogenase
MECVRVHVPAPTLTAAHDLRLVSAFRGERERVKEVFGGDFPPQRISQDRGAFLEDLRVSVYTACLASFVQGMQTIEMADQENKWDIDYSAVLQIWRGECIIQHDYLAEKLEPIFNAHKGKEKTNLLYEPTLAKDLKAGYAALKRVVSACIATDHVCPTLSATLEYVKYRSNTGK